MDFIKPKSTFNHNVRFARSSTELFRNTIFIPKTVKDQYSLSESWKDGGVYVFLGEEIWNYDVFLTAYQDFIQAHTKIRFLWLNNPNEAVGQWSYNYLQSDEQQITSDSTLKFGNHGLKISQGLNINLDINKNQFLISLSNNKIQWRLQQDKTELDLPLLKSGLTISLDEASPIGILQFTLELESSLILEKMNLGLQYFIDSTRGVGQPDALFYPMFDVDQSPLKLLGHLNLASPDPADSYFTFLSSEPLASFYRTTLGHPIALKPQADAKICWGLQPTSLPDAQIAYYPIPHGNFELLVQSDAQTPHRLMCAYSGMEYFKAPTDKRWLLKFISGQPAYAQNFSLLPNLAAAANLEWSSKATTSWCYLIAEELFYYAQPDSAVLHHNAEKQHFLQPLEVPVGQIPPYDLVNAAFTMVPYAGLNAENLFLYQQFEDRALYPSRKDFLQNIIKNASTQSIAVSGTTEAVPPISLLSAKEQDKSITPSPFLANYHPTLDAVSPQGLLATIDKDLINWKTLTLAKDKKGQVLRFANVNDKLRNAFQNNKLFLVASAPEMLADHFTDSLLDLSDWDFDLSPSLWSTYQTFIVFKFFAGKSFKDLAGSTDFWVQAQDFNRQVPDMQKLLIQAISQAETEDDLSYFSEVINNPNWNGILAFNVHIPLNGLPDQLKGLSVGIDASHFKAHHLGVSLSPVQQFQNGRISIGSSALFGLIDYSMANQAPASTPNVFYDFMVKNLKVLFINSQVKDFSSTVHLSVNSLFGESAQKQADGAAAPDNILALIGSYQQHDSQAAYTFKSTAQNLFKLDSAIVNNVQIEYAQFTTVISAKPEAGQNVQTRFILRGKMAFQALQPMDLFSYDALPFSNLMIDMSFNPADAEQKKIFVFDPGNMVFMSSGSKARLGSLVDQFPMVARSFRYAATADLPASFAQVELPVGFSKINTAWFGLVLDLSLGSLGALAPKKDPKAQWLMVWQATPARSSEAGTETPPLPLGILIKLPFGEGGKDFFNIQGVIKMGMSGISLSQQDQSYLITFKNIALRLLMFAFPPGGSTNVYLFGDPAGKSKELAWYGAYVKERKPVAK